MSTLQNKASSATSQHGFTLVETMVAIAIGGAVIILVSSFLVGVFHMQKTVTLRAEMEDLRSIVLPKVDCSAECAGLVRGERTFGHWTVKTECHELFKDAKVTKTHKKIDTIKGPLSSLDAWVCKPRRPQQCLYACHTGGIFLEKGYLYPAIEGASFRNDSDLKCPLGEVIGVDFSTKRIVCAKTSGELLIGPMCKQDVTFGVSIEEPHNVLLAGKTPCSQHTQDQARMATINGPLKIVINPNFKPDVGQTFDILRAERIIGFYTNARNTIEVGPYVFRVTYSLKKVTLRVIKTDR